MFRIKISPKAKDKIFNELNNMKITRLDLMLEESDEVGQMISKINIEMKKLEPINKKNNA